MRTSFERLRAAASSKWALQAGLARSGIAFLLVPTVACSQKPTPAEIRWYSGGRAGAPITLPAALHVPENRTGVAVITDSATWASVWRMSSDLHGLLPHVDFSRVTLVTISYGGQSGCRADTRHIVRVVAGTADTVWVEARRDPNSIRPDTCDGFFTEAELAVIERPHANIHWRAARNESGAPSAPLPTDSLWRKLTRPQR